jgi:hypothetical protein
LPRYNLYISSGITVTASSTAVGKDIIKTLALKSYGQDLFGAAAKSACNKTLRDTTKVIFKHGYFAGRGY